MINFLHNVFLKDCTVKVELTLIISFCKFRDILDIKTYPQFFYRRRT